MFMLITLNEFMLNSLEDSDVVGIIVLNVCL